MNNEQPVSATQNRFVFIFNRFQCRQNGCKRANEIAKNTADFEVWFKDFSDLKTQLQTPLEQLFVDFYDKKASVFQRRWIDNVWSDWNRIADLKTLETFIVRLINCTRILLRAFAKVFAFDYEYFFYKYQIFRFKMNEYCFIHKFDDPNDPFVVLWQRKTLPGDSQAKVELPKIETFEQFYERFADGKPKPKK